MKSSRLDKREATKDTLKGAAREAGGVLRGDDTQRARGLGSEEGRLQVKEG
jgi:uncharacterized protein YjbJ (UPF0337 family)